MMKDIDSLMRHWAEQRRRGPSGLGSQMGSIMEWKGLAPRTGASGSRILIAGAGMDHAAAEIDAAVAELDRRDARGRVLARLALFRYVHEATIREQMREVGLEEYAQRTYWNWVAALHLQVARILVSRVGPNRANTVRRIGMRRVCSEPAPK